MLDNRRARLNSEQLDDPDLLEAIDGIDTREFNYLINSEAMHLERVLEILDGQKDPKGNAVYIISGNRNGWTWVVLSSPSITTQCAGSPD